MLYEWLASERSVFNLLNYITFRTGGATMTALFFVFLFGPSLISGLRLRQGKGQPRVWLRQDLKCRIDCARHPAASAVGRTLSERPAYE